MNERIQAKIYAAAPPNQTQEARFLAFLKRKYGENVVLTYEKSDAFPGGFRLEAGADVYDWSVNGRFRQLKDALAEVPKKSGDVIPMLGGAVRAWSPKAVAEEVGAVVSVGDGVAVVTGLENVAYGEIVEFSSGARGMVQDLKRESAGCILFGDPEGVTAGSAVYRTKRTAGVPVGEGFLGRAVNALGAPIDGKGEIAAAVFPIGRGQRELIIGDRQTGKTAIALDTILNQRGKDVLCIYVAIGQKASSVVQLMEVLKSRGALAYTVIVSASAGESASMQYIAPYAGCAMGEYFMEQGKDVLIVYDDLSKHAVAYRALSLLLGRSPGREAYPGDVFYLHSRLLERAAHLSAERGGGSMTALPIVETQSGDVSAYIPTNIISITDGQIFLESSLFFAGQRPAVNVGLSVSRVGGAAQTQAMKSAAGAIRLDLAQFREMEIFTQFSSDLDEATQRELRYGQGLMRLLRQPQYSPLRLHEQVVLLVAALGRVMENIPAEEVSAFRTQLLAYLEEHAAPLCAKIEKTGKMTAEERGEIERAAREFHSVWQQKGNA